MTTNTESCFTNFEVQPLDGIKVTGIHYIPSTSQSTCQTSDSQYTYRPLIIFIHGATCTAHNFDISPRLTASNIASVLSLPIISINRPGYLSSTPISVPTGTTYHESLGSFYHHHLFPDLWTRFGESSNCTAMVVFAHSFGTPAAIVAAGLHANDPNPNYPQAGLIFSGWGTLPATERIPHPTSTSSLSEKAAWKRQIMFYRAEHDLVPPEALNLLAAQDHPSPIGERDDITTGAWQRYWRRYSDAIVLPIMFAQAEFDFFWEGSEQQVIEIRKCFPNCSRFDGSLIRGAPHAIEWSWMASGWYVRAFGFALEITAAYARQRERGGNL